MNADGSGEVTTGVQCSGVGCAPRWQPRVCSQGHKPVGLKPSPDLDNCSAIAIRNDR